MGVVSLVGALYPRRMKRRFIRLLIGKGDSATEFTGAQKLRTWQTKRAEAIQTRHELQRLRSVRRTRLYLRQKEWIKRAEESAQAREGLWAAMESSSAGVGVTEDLGAWPRLRRRQSRRLIEGVEAFVKGFR